MQIGGGQTPYSADGLLLVQNYLVSIPPLSLLPRLYLIYFHAFYKTVPFVPQQSNSRMSYHQYKQLMHNCFLRVLKDFEITKEDFLYATELCSSNGGAYYDGKKIASAQKISEMCIQLNIPFAKVLLYLGQKLNP